MDKAALGRHGQRQRFGHAFELGGRAGVHKDGWGIAFHDAQGCRLMTDLLAWSDSPLAVQVRQAPQRARNVVAHLRKATQVATTSENSQAGLLPVKSTEVSIAKVQQASRAAGCRTGSRQSDR